MSRSLDAAAWSLPRQLTEDIDDIVQRSCSDSSRSFIDRADALSHASRALYSAVQASLQRISRSINDAVLINQLPRELFIDILLRLAFQDCISMTHVCQQWRSVAINTPPLWTTFKGYSKVDGTLDDAFAVLSRSESAPVTLDLTVWNPGDYVGSLVCQHMHHMRSLTLVLNFSVGGEESAHRHLPLMHALREPAPVLQQIELRVSSHMRPSRTSAVTMPPDLLAGDAPALEAATFSGVVLNTHPYGALSAVRFLCLGAVEVDLPLLLASYPRLEQLLLQARTFITASGGAPGAARSLDLLQITATLPAVNQILAQFTGSRPLTIFMHNVLLDVLDRILSSAPKNAVAHLCLFNNLPFIHRAVELRYSTGLTWNLGYTPDMNTNCISRTLMDADVMSDLTTLTMHELHWPKELLPAAPQLRRLTIILMDYVQKNNNQISAESVGLFCEAPDGPLAVFDCPALEELCLAVRPAEFSVNGTMLVDVYDICTFITRRLRISAGALAGLVLRNIYMFDSLFGGGMEHLTLLALDISYQTMASSPVPYIHKRETWIRWMYLLKE